jgi:hypothetical protein
MPHDPDLDGMLDDALGGILSGGWDDPMGAAQPGPTAEVVPVAAAEQALPKYPPLPAREGQAHGGALKRAEMSQGDEPEGDGTPWTLGILSDLATGRTTPAEVSRRTGKSESDLHDELATALHEMDPRDVAKAMGIQAAEQQLKSGALYGAVIADLASDLVAGRLKPDVKIEFAKMLAKNGRIEPKEDKSVSAGGGFTLNIQMGTAPAQPITIVAD